MQIPRGIRAEVPKEIDLRHVEEGHRRDIERVVPPAWGGIGGGIRDERPYPHVVDDSAEVQCGEYDRFFEREVCDSDIQGLFAGEKELHRASFLGQRVLREHRWLGRADDSRIYQESGTGREAPRADEVGGALSIEPPLGAFIILPALRVVFDFGNFGLASRNISRADMWDIALLITQLRARIRAR